jgi:hypothetical protein
MSVTQIPPRDPPVPPPPEHRDLSDAQHWETAYRGFNPDHVPHLLIQLQDDLSRSRKREAVWLSVVLHLLVVVLLVKVSQFQRTVALKIPTPEDFEKQMNATYLELPADEQKPTRRPDSKIISDKDRIATSKAPQINREDLKKLLERSRTGQPGPMGPSQGSPPPEMAQNQAARQQPPQENQQPSQNSGFSRPNENSQTAQLRAPALGGGRQPSFSTPMTPGSAIEQAARAAAASRGNYGGGEAGDYGLTQGRGGAKALDQAEILTDTMGVDFGPYLAQITERVRQNWYTLMPPSVYPPILKKGKLAIEFVILKDGTITGMARDTSSDDVGLDRAAWGSITMSAPFPPLPKEFPGKLLGLRFYYFYNLEPGSDLR